MPDDVGGAAALLVVCSANVCRSPLAAAVLREALSGGTGLVPAAVASTGVQGLDAAPMCEVSAELLPEAEATTARTHRSRRMTAEQVGGASLVLTMEREHRSAAVRLAPGVQAKVFTLREADALLGALRERRSGPVADLAALARAMHALRGTVAIEPPEAPARRWWQRPAGPVDPLTIVDGHGRAPQEHRAAVEEVERVARSVAGAMDALISRADPGPPEHR